VASTIFDALKRALGSEGFKSVSESTGTWLNGSTWKAEKGRKGVVLDDSGGGHWVTVTTFALGPDGEQTGQLKVERADIGRAVAWVMKRPNR
jgi:hypothetical protein